MAGEAAADAGSIVRIRSRVFLARPDVIALLVRAAGATELRQDRPFDVIDELRAIITSAHVGVFVGFDPYPVVVTIAMLPTSVFQLAPFIVLVYAEPHTPPDLVRRVGARLRSWLIQNGYWEADAANLRHTDRAFMRGFGHFAPSRRFGTLIRFDLGEA